MKYIFKRELTIRLQKAEEESSSPIVHNVDVKNHTAGGTFNTVFRDIVDEVGLITQMFVNFEDAFNEESRRDLGPFREDEKIPVDLF
jgi:hypothetical protein